ncbi:hypothetical protein PMAYCL1PPCAC_03878, partial [Pristionchus mayeri]
LKRIADLHPSNLRYLFYLVTPSETTFANVAEVPDYMDTMSSWMLLLIVISLFVDRKNYPFNDTATSVLSGQLYLLFKLSGSIFSAAIYSAVYEKVHLVDLDIYNPWVWFLAFLAQDLAYYLGHRAMHEFGIFWAFHEMHHSSEYFNLATAVRKSPFLEHFVGVFNLFQAFVIPPQLYVPHKHLNFIYQYWIHNEYLPSLGPLEYVLCTPSNHRVHHGRNPYCIDRNFGGVLIIWDRLFGTYAEEREDEKIAYGLVHNVNTFSLIWTQISSFSYFLRTKCHMKDENGREYFPGFWNKLFSIFAPVGYFPGMKTRRFLFWKHLADNTEGIPEVDHSQPKYDPPTSFREKAYIFFQGFLLMIVYLEMERKRMTMGCIDFWLQTALFLCISQSFGYYLDNHPYAVAYDWCKNVLILVYLLLRPFSLALLLISLTSSLLLTYFQWKDYSNTRKC